MQQSTHKKFSGQKLLLATNNNYKLTEIRQYFENAGISLDFHTPAEFGIQSPPETENTFIGNAELKARFYGKLTSMPALADDTGLCITALGGQPGVYTADWIQQYGDAGRLIEKLYADMREIEDRTAKAACALSLYWPDDDHVESFFVEVPGKLDFAYRSNNIFKAVQQRVSTRRVLEMHNELQGPVVDDATSLNCKGYSEGFATIFVPDGYDIPYVQLTFEQKLKISHRALAFRSLNKACFC